MTGFCTQSSASQGITALKEKANSYYSIN